MVVCVGLGVAVLASWAALPYVKRGGLAVTPLARKGYRRRWSAVTLKDAASIGYIKRFIELLARSEPEPAVRK